MSDELKIFTPDDVGVIRHIPPPYGWQDAIDPYYAPDLTVDAEFSSVYDTDEKRDQLLMLLDPVAWAQHEIKVIEPLTERVIPFEARWYQQILLRARDRYQVWRLGRQTGKSVDLCILALWFAFTHATSHVLMMAPYDEQVKRLFWDRPGIDFMINNSEALSSSIVGKITKSPPYTVHFNNGSTITGMTAGTKSGSSGGAARGARGLSL